MGEPVSDLDLMDMDAEELGRYIDGLEPGPQPTPEEQAELLAQLPPADPEAPITVVTSLRLRPLTACRPRRSSVPRWSGCWPAVTGRP